MWINDNKLDVEPDFEMDGKKFVHMKAAQSRLLRFMPYFEKAFPQTASRKGIIESELAEINDLELKKEVKLNNDTNGCGKIFLKDDSTLQITGNVKDRGCTHEIIKIAEELALKNKMIAPTDNHEIFNSNEFKEFFGHYVLLDNDYAAGNETREAIAKSMGFKLSDCDEKNKLIRTQIPYDNEAIFFACAAAAFRLKVQLRKSGIEVDENNQLFVYLPIKSGLSAAGITFGLKQLFGNNVHCFYYRIINKVEADNNSINGFDGSKGLEGIKEEYLKLSSGIIEVEDKEKNVKVIINSIYDSDEGRGYVNRIYAEKKESNINHIFWKMSK